MKTSGISIPYGAIKSEYKSQGTMSAYEISIPYGAIKSCRYWYEITSYCSISIPYGAIKRLRPLELSELRLLISIPYGAIKRKRFEDNAHYARIFQFLMVRLKVRNNNKHTIKIH